ncbi:MAG: hypothetical protein AB8G26_07595 [Ilumatobacter sp.]
MAVTIDSPRRQDVDDSVRADHEVLAVDLDDEFRLGDEHQQLEPTDERRDLLLPGWPLVGALVGLPLWWVLGLTQLIFFIAAVPMAIYLLRIRTIRLPKDSVTWLLFLGWVAVGVLVLGVAAPGAERGGAGAGRLLTFGYRWGWYLVATIAMLYVVNTRKILSSSRIAGALSIVFLTLVGGGYLGLLVPRLEFASVLETLLPRGLTSNTFVFELVHAQAAQIQTFLGGQDARPSAPFTFTNIWGLNIALTLPFFVAEWWSRGGRWRTAVPPLLVVAAIPIVFSLNRGLWGAVLAMILFIAIRSAIAGRFMALVGLGVAGCIAALALALSPAGDLVSQRLDTGHSNETRSSLGTLSVESAWEGSPLIGFGSTRNVEGNFNSITGGATADCPRCTPPPLGTQGQLWLLVFGGGFGALALYLAFFGAKFVRHLRSRDPLVIAAQCSIIVLFVTMPVYNAVGFGTYVALIAMGLLGRHERPDDRIPLNVYGSRLGRNIGFVAALALAGATIGFIAQQLQLSPARATQPVLVPRDNPIGTHDDRPLPLDSEARIATSAPVLDAVLDIVGASSRTEVLSRIEITAEPNSRILNITYIDRSGRTASDAAQVAATAYLQERNRLTDDTVGALERNIDARTAEIDRSFPLTDDADGDVVTDAYASVRLSAQRTIANLEADRLEARGDGQLLSVPKVIRPNDALVVRVASGLTLGALVGLALMGPRDRRRRRLGPTPLLPLGPYEVPAVARASVRAIRDNDDEQLDWIHRTAAAYRPLAAVLAAPDSPISMHLAEQLEAGFDRPDARAGRRILFVAETNSRHQHVLDLLEDAKNSGMEPVGLVLIG